MNHTDIFKHLSEYIYNIIISERKLEQPSGLMFEGKKIYNSSNPFWHEEAIFLVNLLNGTDTAWNNFNIIALVQDSRKNLKKALLFENAREEKDVEYIKELNELRKDLGRWLTNNNLTVEP